MRKIFTLFIAALCCAVTINATEGALRGKFSISSTKQIQFSKGNLQYQASTDTWRFAENQWDTIGIANKNISESYDGWIDLFGFSTGNKPTERSQYYDNYETTFNHDWGANAISNGGNEPNHWRTMSPDEWAYIFHDRANAKSRLGLGKVNGVNGFILLPDDWEKPISMEFASCAVKGFETQWNGNPKICMYYDESVYADHYPDNVYTSEEWQVMEQAGAVFFPAAGLRYNGTSILYVNSRGHYWTTTAGCVVEFQTSHMYSGDAFQLQYGASVRLVQPYDEHQAIDNTSVKVKATKCIKNGQIFILRDGKTYNAQGAEVR